LPPALVSHGVCGASTRGPLGGRGGLRPANISLLGCFGAGDRAHHDWGSTWTVCDWVGLLRRPHRRSGSGHDRCVASQAEGE